MEDLILVLNLGLKSIRSIVFNQRGEILKKKSAPITTYLKGEFVEQDPDEWIQKGMKVLMDTLLEDEIRKGIKYITVTCSAACLVCVDSNRQSLRNAIMVSDKRAYRQAQSIAECKAFNQVYKETNIPSDSYLMIPKILWIKENELETYTKTFKFLSPNDYLLAHFTGSCATDSFNAQKYFYHLKTKRYPLELLKELDISVEKLPMVIEPCERLGNIERGVCKELGLNSDVQCIVSTYDAICSFIGSGPQQEGDACDVSGTVTSLRVLCNQENGEKISNLFFTPFYQKDIYIAGGSNNLGGGLIEWTKQLFYSLEPSPYELMENDAKSSSLGARGIWFLPYLLGERAPLWDKEIRAAFFGLERYHGREDMVRAIFESVGFSLLTLIDELENNCIKVNTMRVSGGLTRIHFISEIKADITGRPVYVLKEFETTALGAFLLVKMYIDKSCTLKELSNKYVTIEKVIAFDEIRHDKYMKIYKLYKDLYFHLKDLCLERKDILSEIYEEEFNSVQNL